MHLTAGLIHALPIKERRVFTRDEAASYVGVSPGHFSKLVRDGTMPDPLPSFGRARRWDKTSLDRTLDAAIGFADPNSTPPNAYDVWKATNGQG